MRRFVFAVCLAVLFCGSPCRAEGGIGFSGEVFLKRMAGVSYRVSHGFSVAQIADAEWGQDSVSLYYNRDIFLVINLTPPNGGVKNIFMVLATEDSDLPPDEPVEEAPLAGAGEIFEDICRQMIYTLHPSIDEGGAEKLTGALGIEGEALDGIQRSACLEKYRYIARYNKDGMLVVVVSAFSGQK